MRRAYITKPYRIVPIKPSVMLMQLFLLLFSFGLLIPSTAGLGIMPASTKINFVPNLNITKSFYILNQEQVNQNITLSKTGELSDFIELYNKSIGLKNRSRVFYRLRLPESYDAGLHKGFIIVKSKPRTNGFSATVALRYSLNLFVPKEYSRVLVRFDYKKSLVITMKNTRNKSIDFLLRAYIKENQRTIKDFQISGTLKPFEEKNITKGVKLLGEYKIYYSFTSKEISFNSSATIKAGEQKIILFSDIKRMEANRINKIPVKLENLWNKNESVKIKTILRKGAEVFAKTENKFKLKPHEIKHTNIYIEAPESGNYTLEFILKYNGIKRTFIRQVEVKTLIKRDRFYLNQQGLVILASLFVFVMVFVIWKMKQKS